MNVTDATSTNVFVTPSTALQVQPAATATSNACGDGDGNRVHHHGHHRGGMGGALMQALKGLGLTAADGSAQTASSDHDGDDAGSAAGTAHASIKGDIRSFMHALFQAVRSESSGASDGSTAAVGAATTGAGAGSDPQAGFASGLSALITQVGNGSAPSDLQSAFDKLASDLQAVKGAAPASSAAGTADASSAPSATLLQLLTQMQQNLGYGPRTASTATGNLVGTSA
ncbi:MAG TPA: hypothetical protein VML58_03075 [Burkholderiaceae bacterium]|nr:hypothetical protein [Burkholderiaceae bacterium]